MKSQNIRQFFAHIKENGRVYVHFLVFIVYIIYFNIIFYPLEKVNDADTSDECLVCSVLGCPNPVCRRRLPGCINFKCHSLIDR
jgi:hypothetical protein